jgi:hypothetical protein
MIFEHPSTMCSRLETPLPTLDDLLAVTGPDDLAAEPKEANRGKGKVRNIAKKIQDTLQRAADVIGDAGFFTPSATKQRRFENHKNVSRPEIPTFPDVVSCPSFTVTENTGINEHKTAFGHFNAQYIPPDFNTTYVDFSKTYAGGPGVFDQHQMGENGDVELQMERSDYATYKFTHPIDEFAGMGFQPDMTDAASDDPCATFFPRAPVFHHGRGNYEMGNMRDIEDMFYDAERETEYMREIKEKFYDAERELAARRGPVCGRVGAVCGEVQVAGDGESETTDTNINGGKAAIGDMHSNADYRCPGKDGEIMIMCVGEDISEEESDEEWAGIATPTESEDGEEWYPA